MADPMTGPAPHCQWCSALLPAADLPTCPSCGATLTSTTGGEEIKGVTTLDPEAILRARSEVARPRSRLLSFITGEQPVEVGGPVRPSRSRRPTTRSASRCDAWRSRPSARTSRPRPSR